MAAGLYHIRRKLEHDHLQNKAVTHVFRAYESSQIVPNCQRLNQVFAHWKQKSDVEYLCSLFTDVCVKRKHLWRPIFEEVTDVLAGDLPRLFLQDFCVAQFNIDTLRGLQDRLKLNSYYCYL